MFVYSKKSSNQPSLSDLCCPSDVSFLFRYPNKTESVTSTFTPSRKRFTTTKWRVLVQNHTANICHYSLRPIKWEYTVWTTYAGKNQVQLNRKTKNQLIPVAQVGKCYPDFHQFWKFIVHQSTEATNHSRAWFERRSEDYSTGPAKPKMLVSLGCGQVDPGSAYPKPNQKF